MLAIFVSMTLKKTILPFFVLCILAAGLLPFVVRADSDLTVLPIVVDEKAKARDILKESVTITNNSARVLQIYPSVNDVKPQEGQRAFIEAQSGTERSDSLANWIEISRGVIELKPKESKEIPFVIRVNLNAVAGTYHADVSFYEGGNREDAEKTHPLSVVTVNTEVQANIKESMQLNKFVTDSFFFSGDDVLFNYQLENIGNQELKPKGEIRIYDRKGHEVATVPVNPDGKSFTPDQAAQLASAWSAARGFGKFKAFLNIDYGNGNGSLQDTVFFWIIPWQQLLAIVVVSIIGIIVSALYFHRWLEQRHMQRFALATGMPMAGAGVAAMQAPPGMLTQKRPPHMTTVMPVIPKQEKKSFFSRFRRANKAPIVASVQNTSPIPTVVPAAALLTPPVHNADQSQIIVHGEESASAPVQTLAPQSNRTINLSSTNMGTSPQKNPGRVINLKNGS